MKPIYYRGYLCQRNRLTQQWYAIPMDTLSLGDKLRASDLSALRIEIDRMTPDLKPDPWELPRATRRTIASLLVAAIVMMPVTGGLPEVARKCTGSGGGRACEPKIARAIEVWG